MSNYQTDDIIMSNFENPANVQNTGVFFSSNSFTSQGPNQYLTLSSQNTSMYRGNNTTTFASNFGYAGTAPPNEQQFLEHQQATNSQPLTQFLGQAGAGFNNILLDQVGTHPQLQFANQQSYQPQLVDSYQPRLIHGSQQLEYHPQVVHGSQQLEYQPQVVHGSQQQLQLDYQSATGYGSQSAYGSQQLNYPPNQHQNDQFVARNSPGFPPNTGNVQQHAPNPYGSQQYNQGPLPPTQAPAFLSVQTLPGGRQSDEPPAYDQQPQTNVRYLRPVYQSQQ